MKKLYFILLVTFSVTFTYSQTCPPEIKSSSTTVVVFKIQGGSGASCGDYPAMIDIDGSTFNQTSCNGANLEYTLSLGPQLAAPTDSFTATIGPNTCNYVNGQLSALSNEDFAINEKTVKMYPNPLKRGDVLNFEFPIVLDSKVIMYDMLGKQVLVKNGENSNIIAIRTASLRNGIYVLKVETNEGNFSRKIIIK